MNTFRSLNSLPWRRLSMWVFLALAVFFVAAAPVAAQEAAAAAAEESAGGEQKSMLVWIAECSGLIGLFILILSIYFLATVIQLFIELRESEVAPREVVENCDQLIQQRNFRQVLETVKQDDSPLAQVMAAGIMELPYGLNEARHAMERTNESLITQMEKRISILAVLGTLGPMIGLLGTLKGMIASFSVIATSGVNLKPQEVAGGISEALLLTFEGVALSVPSIYFFSFFKNRINTLMTDLSLTADTLVRKIYQASKTKAAPAAATAQAT